MKVESSTTRTRNFLLVVAIVRLRYRGDRARRLRSYKLFDGRDQLIFLNRLGQKCRGAFLDRTISMLGPRARCNDHHGNSPRRWALAQLHHQFVTGHARHFEVGNDQMATMLFKSISRIRLPSGAIVVPGKSFTRRKYSPRFLITISSLPRTSSTTTPIFRFPAFATTIRK